MAFQNPIFNGNLYGGLTRFAMNGFAQTQRVATANAAGIKFAQGEAFAKAPTKSVLVSLDSATAISGAFNRWTYSVKIWFPTPVTGTGITVPTNDLSGTYAAAINLREWYNTSTLVDGMNISISPAATVGPVGSIYDSGTSSWPTGQLSAKVELHVSNDSTGAVFAYFDRPNPMRCT
jgi:energy-converting hydrogenase Eha subunit A